MKISLLAAAVLLGALGCGDDGGSPIDAPVVDAPVIDGQTAVDAAMIDAVPIDGVPSSVHVVTCPTDSAQIASEVTIPGFAYTITQSTISTGSIVKFTTVSIHNATSGTVNGGIPTPDGVFRVPFNVTQCLQFTASGTFPFYCEFHFFTGSLTVVDPT